MKFIFGIGALPRTSLRMLSQIPDQLGRNIYPLHILHSIYCLQRFDFVSPLENSCAVLMSYNTIYNTIINLHSKTDRQTVSLI